MSDRNHPSTRPAAAASDSLLRQMAEMVAELRDVVTNNGSGLGTEDFVPPAGYRLLTPEQAMVWLGISERTLREWTAKSEAAGGIPHIKVGGQLRFKEQNLMEWLDRGGSEPKKAAPKRGHRGRQGRVA